MPTSKRLRAPLIVMFGMIMAVVAFAAPANAAPYAEKATISVSNQTPTAGSTIQVCGLGFENAETVTIFLDQNRGGRGTQLALVTTTGSGGFCTGITVGANLKAAHKLTATGTTSGRTASTEIRVLGNGISVLGVSANAAGTSANAAGTSANAGVKVAGVSQSASAGTSGLAFTGAAVIGVGALGGLLLLGGAVMVFAGRRRKVNA
jgi:hypothetical protein